MQQQTPKTRINESTESSDRSLLRRFKKGENDAATALYLRYAKRLQALARSKTSDALTSRFDPEDVVQSVFRTFFRRAAEGMYEVPPGEQLWHLLLVLALNKVRTLGIHHRAIKRDVTKTMGGEAVTNSIRDGEQPLKFLQMVIAETIDQIPDSQRQVIQLRIEGYQIEEISTKTNRSKRTIERILKRFRERLSKLIDAE